MRSNVIMRARLRNTRLRPRVEKRLWRSNTAEDLDWHANGLNHQLGLERMHSQHMKDTFNTCYGARMFSRLQLQY